MLLLRREPSNISYIVSVILLLSLFFQCLVLGELLGAVGLSTENESLNKKFLLQFLTALICRKSTMTASQ